MQNLQKPFGHFWFPTAKKWSWIKILPYWLIFLILAVLTQAGFALFFRPGSQSRVYNPEVLGATAAANDIRGEAQDLSRPIVQTNNPDLSEIKAKSFLVFDLTSGQTLLEKNSSVKLAIASLSKLMTALTVYNNTSLNQSFTIVNKDSLNVLPSLKLIPGDEVSALDIFNAMLIGSCNDAALALSRYTEQVLGSNFVALMNRQAEILGMQNTKFSNPMGFDSRNNYSTAEDLKLLISAVEKLSVFTDLGRRTDYSFTGTLNQTYFTRTTNSLLKNHPEIQAIKTGYTNEAHGAMATKIGIGRHQIVILVLDSQNRENDTLKLKAAVSESFNWD